MEGMNEKEVKRISRERSKRIGRNPNRGGKGTAWAVGVVVMLTVSAVFTVFSEPNPGAGLVSIVVGIGGGIAWRMSGGRLMNAISGNVDKRAERKAVEREMLDEQIADYMERKRNENGENDQNN